MTTTLSTTKKLPDAILLPSGKIKRERLIPFFDPTNRSGFLGLKTGKRHRHGIMVYLGVPITAEDILNRYLEFHDLPKSRRDCIAVLDAYVRALQSFKIGNVLSIDYSEGGEFALTKVMDTPPAKVIPLP